MKKFTALAFAVLFMMFVTSCGSDSKTEEKLPDEEVTDEDVVEPTDEPTEEPTTNPTDEPTEEPTDEPTDEPTVEPTDEPTEEPTDEPTDEPTEPTVEPTVEPTEPTVEPTDEPTVEPTEPTVEPTEPTVEPTEPTVEPTEPTVEPTEPTVEPTEPTTPEGCLQITNGDFSGTWSEAGVPESWEKDDSSTYTQLGEPVVTFTNVDGALKIYSKYDGNQKVIKTAKFSTAADAEIPTGIKFRMAAKQPSPVVVNLMWGEGGNDYYSYNWNALSNAFLVDKSNNHRTNDFNNAIDFGDTENPQMHDVVVIFGPEMNDKWQNNSNLQLVLRLGKSSTYGETEITVDNFELVYFGGECNNVPARTVGWAAIKHPHSIEGYAGTTETLYGRVWIDGITDQTVNKSVALMGVKAQCCSRPKDSDMLYTNCKDAEVNIAENSEGSNAFGNNDEYKCDYPFNEAGEFEYIFQFSADNGNTWKKTTDFSSDGDFTAQGYANILAPEANQIPNGDFKYWINDTTNPQLWTISNVDSSEKTTVSGNDALTLNRNKNANSGGVLVLTSPDFTVSDDAKLPTELAFNLTVNNETTAMSMKLICGSSSQDYIWSTNKFAPSNNKYNTLPSGLNNTKIEFGEEMTESFWQGKTCRLEIRYSKAGNCSATFDDFRFVYPD